MYKMNISRDDKIFVVVVIAILAILAISNAIYNACDYQVQITQLEDQLAAQDADCAVLQNTIDPLYADVAKMRLAVTELTATVRRLAELMEDALEPATE